MEPDHLTLTLSIWGSTLATAIAIKDIIVFRREYRTKLLVLATAETPYDTIQISIVNDSSKPVTITGYAVRFGPSFDFSTELVHKPLDAERKLSESDRWTTLIGRQEILDALKRAEVVQKPFQLLWVSVLLSNGKKFTDSVYISPGIITKPYYEKAGQFIATDLFLGFRQMDAEFYPIGVT